MALLCDTPWAACHSRVYSPFQVLPHWAQVHFQGRPCVSHMATELQSQNNLLAGWKAAGVWLHDSTSPKISAEERWYIVEITLHTVWSGGTRARTTGPTCDQWGYDQCSPGVQSWGIKRPSAKWSYSGTYSSSNGGREKAQLTRNTRQWTRSSPSMVHCGDAMRTYPGKQVPYSW